MERWQRPRIFISSVMRDYDTIREAAASGIRAAGGVPIRAEDFPSLAVSSRTACLDGVASADAVVLILGARYGWVTPSGVAATEEEYQEARSRQKPIFVFVEEVEREAAQTAFVQRVGDYVHGHYRRTFRSGTDLEALVETAIREAHLMHTPNPQSVNQTIEQAFNERYTELQGETGIQVVWTSARNEEIIDPLQLRDSTFQKRIQRVAHEGAPSVFEYIYAKRVEATLARLRLIQAPESNTQRRETNNICAIDIYPRGTLAITMSVTGLDTSSNEWQRATAAMAYLDPADVRSRLEAACNFAERWWHDMDPYLRQDPLIYNALLFNRGYRRWASRPATPPQSFTMPGGSHHDTIVLFDQPRSLSRSGLSVPTSEIDRILATIAARLEDRH